MKGVKQYVYGASENVSQQEEQQLVVIQRRDDADIEVFGEFGAALPLAVERGGRRGSQHVHQREQCQVRGQEDDQHHTPVGELEESRNESTFTDVIIRTAQVPHLSLKPIMRHCQLIQILTAAIH